MATVTKPIALDESFNTTEQTPRNLADVLAEGIGDLISAVSRIAPQTTYDELEKLEDVNISNPTNGQVLKYNGSKWYNGNESGGGSGDSVSWNQITQSGTKIAEITINGSKTDVYAPQGGSSFSALIIVTDILSGITVTATKNGVTKTGTSIGNNQYEIDVDSAGTWTITDGTNTTTVQVSSQTTYNVTLGVPTGSTVTPTDDIQTLLNCANIWDKNYTTLSELLADTTTLQTVISSNNAIDYLVRSTTWASDMCANSTAMSYIGLNNYASNTLLANATWCNAICNSQYFESVLNVKVPTMTSNNTPSGEAYGEGLFNNTNYDYYGAFSNAKMWYSTEGVTQAGKYVAYDFTEQKKILVI